MCTWNEHNIVNQLSSSIKYKCLKQYLKKYLGINLIKEVEDLYHENYKIYLKETEDINKWKEISSSWTGRLIKTSVLP